MFLWIENVKSINCCEGWSEGVMESKLIGAETGKPDCGKTFSSLRTTVVTDE